MKSRLLILVIALLSITIAGQAFAAATLTPYPTKVPKGAYVNGGGVNTDDNFFWQMLTLTTVDAAHSGGSGFTLSMPTDMTVADVNNDGNYTGEISAVWNDADGGNEFTKLRIAAVNATNNTISFSIGDQNVLNGTTGGFNADATGWTLAGGAAYGAGVVDLGGGTATQNVYAIPGQTYVVKYTAAGAGTVTTTIGGTSGAANAAGAVSELLTATTTGSLILTGAGVSSIDNVLVVPSMIQNGTFTGSAAGWSLGTGWSYSANTALHSVTGAPTDSLFQNVQVKAGKFYELTFTTTGTVGTVTPSVGGTAGTAVNFGTTGNVQQFTAGGDGNLKFVPTGTFDGAIDNVILTELTVINGTFNTAITGWGGTATWLANRAHFASSQTLTQAFSPIVAAGQKYTVIYDIANLAAAGTIRFSLGGVNGTTRAANGHYEETVTATGAGILTFTEISGVGNLDIDNVVVIRHDQTMEVGDKVYVMVPVETSGAPTVTSDDWYVTFTDGLGDNITNGSGTAITYVTPSYSALSLVTFADNLSADDDTTNALGDRYPTAASAMWSALPDMVIDGTGTAFTTSPNVGLNLNGTENGTESLFAVWVSTSPNLAHVDSLISGVSFAAKYTDLQKYLVNEGDTGGVQFALGGLPEGSYYFYVTSYLTGDFVLGRSGRVVVRHWPVINRVGYDYDHDGLYIPSTTVPVALNDDRNVTLDSGSYFDYSGAKAYTNQFTALDIYASVSDLDDNAKVFLFYSTSSSIDSSKVLRTVSPVDGTITITGLDGATAIASNLLENSEDDQGYIKTTWQVHPDSTHVVLPANNYTIYAVTTDGKHFDISALKGAGSTSLTTSIKHSPNLRIDALSEYDSDAVTAGVQLDVKTVDTIMLSWGKSGVNGALDFDDAAIISFYIHKDLTGATDTDTDYNHAGYRDAINTLWNDAATSPTTTHRIAAGLQENLDSKGNMYYAWNLKEDFKATGWYPIEGWNYFLYAVIDENKTGGTVRCVTLGTVTAGTSASFFLNTLDGGPTSLAGYQIQFKNTPFSRLIDPPAEGVSINAEETYRMRFNAFDWDADANIGIFAVKNTTTGYVDGPMTTTVAALDTLQATAYMLSDDDGYYPTGNTTVSENSSTYYDATIRVPGSATAKYSTTMFGAPTNLADGTYWVYVGSWKSSIFNNLVSNGTFTGSEAGWALAGAVPPVYSANSITFGAGVGTATQTAVATNTYAYELQFTMSNATTGTITPSLGGTAGTARSTSGTYRQTITSGVGGNLVFTSTAGTTTIDNVTLTPVITNGGFNVGGALTPWVAGGANVPVYAAGPPTVARFPGPGVGTLTHAFTPVVGQSYTLRFVITSYTSGSLTPSFGGVTGLPVSAVGTYTQTFVATGAGALVFTGNPFVGDLDDISIAPTVNLYRAPGPLTVINSGVAASQRNLSVSPMEATVAQGDTVSFSIRGADNGAAVDRIDAYVAVEKAYWTLVTPTTPFTAALAFSGKLIANQLIDDAANNRWILRTVVFDAGNPLTLDDTGVGTPVATVQLVSKGTASALQEVTSIYYVNEPVVGRVSKFSNNGSDLSINSFSSTVKVIPRPIIEGIVQLQGRNSNNVPITFELRKRGSYSSAPDSLFYATNDADTTRTGIQFTPDSDGKFTFTKVPIGEFDLVASYSRYLSKLVQVNVYPGLDTLFVSFGTLLGGDAIGYTDSLSAVYPDNAIDLEDINRITAAFLADSTNTNWGGLTNWKWADIDENGVVETPDLSMATANYGTSGAQPVYKTASQPVASNLQSLVEFANVPSVLKSGEKYTIQVIARNTSGVRAYFVNMNYNTNALSFDGIRKGDFISSNSQSFPVLGTGTVGLANSVFGDQMFSGDGVLAEITFTARQDGVFSSNMVSFAKVEFVNGNFMKEDLVDNTTGVKGNTPAIFALGQNFPNPFNPSTTIGFTLPETSKVSIDIYDILGRHVRTLTDGSFAAGKYSVVWDARDANGYQVSTGIYIYKIQAGNFSSVKRMAFMK